MPTGADTLIAALHRLGVRHIFGVPGTQTVGLYEALRCSRVESVLATSELAAAFMANGYYRASGQVSVVITIPGPGLAYTLPAIAEAAHDSAALLVITLKPAGGRPFALQAIDQRAIFAPVVRAAFTADRMEDLENTVEAAFQATLKDEPGPVLLEIEASLLSAVHNTLRHRPSPDLLAGSNDVISESLQHNSIERGVESTLAASRLAIITGQGAFGAAPEIRQVAEALGAAVITMRSGRGLLPETHPLLFRFDFSSDDGLAQCNHLLASADCILVLGCKLSHNGSHGFRLRLDPEKLIHVDRAESSLQRNYLSNRACVVADAGVFCRRILARIPDGAPPRDCWITRPAYTPAHPAEPLLGDSSHPADFFNDLRRNLLPDGIVVTDSGAHQVLCTRHFPVLSARGLILPTDFQSMGFGLPAAIGARKACPDQEVIALIGDGGLLMTGMELSTLARLKLKLILIVFNDGALGQIRSQQQSSNGVDFSTRIATPDLQEFASSFRIGYRRWTKAEDGSLKSALGETGPVLVEVSVRDSARMRRVAVEGTVRRLLRSSKRRLGSARRSVRA